MRNIAVLLLTLVFSSSTAFADNDRQDRFGDKLMIAGATTFTVGYSAMSAAGTYQAVATGGDPSTGLFYLPVGGPLYIGGWFASQPHAPTELAGLAIADGIVQIAGITLMIAGSVHHHRAAARSTTTASLR